MIQAVNPYEGHFRCCYCPSRHAPCLSLIGPFCGMLVVGEVPWGCSKTDLDQWLSCSFLLRENTFLATGMHYPSGDLGLLHFKFCPILRPAGINMNRSNPKCANWRARQVSLLTAHVPGDSIIFCRSSVYCHPASELEVSYPYMETTSYIRYPC